MMENVEVNQSGEETDKYEGVQETISCALAKRLKWTITAPFGYRWTLHYIRESVISGLD